MNSSTLTVFWTRAPNLSKFPIDKVEQQIDQVRPRNHNLTLDIASTRTASDMAGIHTPEAVRIADAPSTANVHNAIDPNKMTFGIELEFLLIHPDGCFAPLQLDGMSNAIKAIDHLLNTNSIPSQCLYTGPTGAPRFSRWNVDRDCHRLTDAERSRLPPNHTVVPIEVSSRKLKLHTDDWQQEVRKVVETITGLSDIGCLTLTSQECGFHVHIGYDDEPVPFQTCKNIFQIATALERCFDQLHTTSRIVPGDGVSFDRPYHFNAPLSWFHKHATRNAGTGDEATIFDWLCEIEDCETYQDIDQMFRVELQSAQGPRTAHGHFGVLNFGNCVEYNPPQEPKATGTVGFRQHEGTLDYDDICGWIELTARLVTFCDVANPRDIVYLCGHAWDPNFSLFNLMKRIGCDANLIAYWRERRSFATHLADQVNVFEDRARLKAGEFSALYAMWLQCGVDRFERFSPFGNVAVSDHKKRSGALGRVVRYYPANLVSSLSVFDAAAAEAMADRRTAPNPKRAAFSMMSA